MTATPSGADLDLDSPPAPLRPDLRAAWGIRPDIAFLNHGSFGATPRVVLGRQQDLRTQMEAELVEFLDRRRDEMAADAKAAVAPLIGARPDDFGFVTNATEGVNAVLRSRTWEPGDELLTTHHVYNAVRQTMRYVAHRDGARVVEARLEVPVAGPDAVVATIENALTERTRLLVIDHVTSRTALILPVKRIIEVCRARGVDVLVDGAHAPGMLELDIEGLGAAYYTGNLHKWVCAPKGAAFLWVDPSRQPEVHPAPVSHFYEEGFAKEFSWQGTRDMTAWYAVGRAIAFFEDLGWTAVRAYNHHLVRWAARMLSARWGVAPIAPASGAMTGSMATLPLPDGLRERFDDDDRALQRALYHEHRVEAPIESWEGRWWVRISAQVYNEPSEYERLGQAVDDMRSS